MRANGKQFLNGVTSRPPNAGTEMYCIPNAVVVKAFAVFLDLTQRCRHKFLRTAIKSAKTRRLCSNYDR